MPRIVSTVHDPIALARTCRQLGLPPPAERSAQLDEAVFGWVVRLPGLRFPIVCDTLTGLIAYHPVDNAHDRFARIARFVLNYYDLRAQWRRDGEATASDGRLPVRAKKGT
jgi:hypothetical protein